jgi:hypothetical protein
MMGAWVQQEPAYCLWCSECGQEKVYDEVWIENPAADTAQVSGFNPPNGRLHCVLCDAVNLVTRSPKQAQLMRWWATQEVSK